MKLDGQGMAGGDSCPIIFYHTNDRSLVYSYTLVIIPISCQVESINPKGYAGYGASCWGLTASDGDNGYSAHSPTNDKGVIAPIGPWSIAIHWLSYQLAVRLKASTKP